MQNAQEQEMASEAEEYGCGTCANSRRQTCT
jgi:hypothetical protein